MKATIALLLSFLISFPAFAADSREDLIREMVDVIGMKKMFEEQNAQQRDSIVAYAKQLYGQVISGSGGVESEHSKEAFIRLISRCSEMITVDEVTERWVSYYGEGLTDDDLINILAFYKSPLGRKDIAATQAAMKPFTAWVLSESQKRSEALISEFIREMQSANAPGGG